MPPRSKPSSDDIDSELVSIAGQVEQLVATVAAVDEQIGFVDGLLRGDLATGRTGILEEIRVISRRLDGLAERVAAADAVSARVDTLEKWRIALMATAGAGILGGGSAVWQVIASALGG